MEKPKGKQPDKKFRLKPGAAAVLKIVFILFLAVTLIFIAFAFGCNIGCSVIVSQFFGAKEYEKMKTAVYTTWIASIGLCVFLMACGLGFCDGILTLIHTQDEIFSDSKLYLNIYILLQNHH